MNVNSRRSDLTSQESPCGQEIKRIDLCACRNRPCFCLRSTHRLRPGTNRPSTLVLERLRGFALPLLALNFEAFTFLQDPVMDEDMISAN